MNVMVAISRRSRPKAAENVQQRVGLGRVRLCLGVFDRLVDLGDGCAASISATASSVENTRVD